MVITKAHQCIGTWRNVCGMVCLLRITILVVELLGVDSLAILAMPLMILVIWCVLLFDLQELPQALDDIKDSVVGLKERVLNHKPDPVKVVVKLKTARQLPSLLRELFDLAQGVDAINTVVAHVVFWLTL